MSRSETQIIQEDFYNHLLCILHASLGTKEYLSYISTLGIKQNDNYIQNELNCADPQAARERGMWAGKWSKTGDKRSEKRNYCIFPPFNQSCIKSLQPKKNVTERARSNESAD